MALSAAHEEKTDAAQVQLLIDYPQRNGLLSEVRTEPTWFGNKFKFTTIFNSLWSCSNLISTRLGTWILR